MRQMISGLVAAAAVMVVSAAPASACGGLGLFSSCSPCGQAYVSPCAQAYAPVAPVFNFGGGCGGCGGGYAGYERLPELSPQYYHVNQGPTYTGPGNFAPYPTYRENAAYGWGSYGNGYDGGYGYGGGGYYGGAAVSYAPRPYYRPWRARTHYGYGVGSGIRYGYGVRPSLRYGHGVGVGYGVGRGVGLGYGVGRAYGPRYGMGYGAQRYGAPRGYGRPGMRRY
jgi:hypothetical protein